MNNCFNNFLWIFIDKIGKLKMFWLFFCCWVFLCSFTIRGKNKNWNKKKFKKPWKKNQNKVFVNPKKKWVQKRIWFNPDSNNTVTNKWFGEMVLSWQNRVKEAFWTQLLKGYKHAYIFYKGRVFKRKRKLNERRDIETRKKLLSFRMTVRKKKKKFVKQKKSFWTKTKKKCFKRRILRVRVFKNLLFFYNFQVKKKKSWAISRKRFLLKLKSLNRRKKINSFKNYRFGESRIQYLLRRDTVRYWRMRRYCPKIVVRFRPLVRTLPKFLYNLKYKYGPNRKFAADVEPYFFPLKVLSKFTQATLELSFFNLFQLVYKEQIFSLRWKKLTASSEYDIQFHTRSNPVSQYWNVQVLERKLREFCKKPKKKALDFTNIDFILKWFHNRNQVTILMRNQDLTYREALLWFERYPWLFKMTSELKIHPNEVFRPNLFEVSKYPSCLSSADDFKVIVQKRYEVVNSVVLLNLKYIMVRCYIIIKKKKLVSWNWSVFCIFLKTIWRSLLANVGTCLVAYPELRYSSNTVVLNRVLEYTAADFDRNTKILQEAVNKARIIHLINSLKTIGDQIQKKVNIGAGIRLLKKRKKKQKKKPLSGEAKSLYAIHFGRLSYLKREQILLSGLLPIVYQKKKKFFRKLKYVLTRLNQWKTTLKEWETEKNADSVRKKQWELAAKKRPDPVQIWKNLWEPKKNADSVKIADSARITPKLSARFFCVFSQTQLLQHRFKKSLVKNQKLLKLNAKKKWDWGRRHRVWFFKNKEGFLWAFNKLESTLLSQQPMPPRSWNDIYIPANKSAKKCEWIKLHSKLRPRYYRSFYFRGPSKVFKNYFDDQKVERAFSSVKNYYKIRTLLQFWWWSRLAWFLSPSVYFNRFWYTFKKGFFPRLFSYFKNGLFSYYYWNRKKFNLAFASRVFWKFLIFTRAGQNLFFFGKTNCKSSVWKHWQFYSKKLLGIKKVQRNLVFLNFFRQFRSSKRHTRNLVTFFLDVKKKRWKTIGRKKRWRRQFKLARKAWFKHWKFSKKKKFEKRRKFFFWLQMHRSLSRKIKLKKPKNKLKIVLFFQHFLIPKTFIKRKNVLLKLINPVQVSLLSRKKQYWIKLFWWKNFKQSLNFGYYSLVQKKLFFNLLLPTRKFYLFLKWVKKLMSKNLVSKKLQRLLQFGRRFEVFFSKFNVVLRLMRKKIKFSSKQITKYKKFSWIKVVKKRIQTKVISLRLPIPHFDLEKSLDFLDQTRAELTKSMNLFSEKDWKKTNWWVLLFFRYLNFFLFSQTKMQYFFNYCKSFVETFNFKKLTEYLMMLKLFYKKYYQNKKAKVLPNWYILKLVYKFFFLTGQKKLVFLAKQWKKKFRRLQFKLRFVNRRSPSSVRTKKSLYKLKILFDRLFIWLYGQPNIRYIFGQVLPALFVNNSLLDIKFIYRKSHKIFIKTNSA